MTAFSLSPLPRVRGRNQIVNYGGMGGGGVCKTGGNRKRSSTVEAKQPIHPEGDGKKNSQRKPKVYDGSYMPSIYEKKEFIWCPPLESPFPPSTAKAITNEEQGE